MSGKRLPNTQDNNQASIKSCTYRKPNSPISDIHERAKQLRLTAKKQERAKLDNTPLTPPKQPKHKTPPSRKEELAKKLHFEESPKMMDPEKASDSTNELSGTQEDRIMEKIKRLLEPIQQSIKNLETKLDTQQEDLKQLRSTNTVLENRIKRMENQNRDLIKRIQKREDKFLQNNVVLQGISESAWESEENCNEKVRMTLPNIVQCNTYAEKINIARGIPIKSAKRIGRYNPLQTHPISVEFECHGDVEYLLEHKRNLGNGIFTNKEYGPETEKNRKLLRPIFNAARKHPEYKGKCRMEDNTLVIHGKMYTVDNLCSLPEDISGYKVSSKSNNTTLAFFGQLNPFSNFHPCKFEYSGMQFHSSKQLIQYMKAVLFDDTLTATSILDSIQEELIKGDNTSSETDTIVPQDYDRMDTTHTSHAEET